MNENRNMADLYHKVFETKWFSIEATSDNFSNNKPYYRMSCNDSVGILAVTTEQKIILVRQFRPALGIYTLEFPAGYVDKKELARDAIKRELREETGFVCDSVIFMGSFQLVPSRMNHTSHVFFGKGAKAIDVNKREEEIEVILVTEDKFKRLITDGQFVETAGLATYLLSKLQRFL